LHSKDKMSVIIVMGGAVDLPKVQPAAAVLDELKIAYTMRILSAHKTPHKLRHAIEDLGDEVACVIAAAGKAAALPGAIAALTSRPVIGLPLKGSTLGAKDALYAMVQMPTGVPVLTVGIDNATNAALAAAQILGVTNPQVRAALVARRAAVAAQVLKADAALAYT
jgi:5-(carboxyamino)imidazole ribonucleotide mutase